MFDDEQCDNVLKDLTTRNFEIHTFTDYNAVTGKEIHQPLNYTGEIESGNHKLIIDGYWQCLSKYVMDVDAPWFASWNGFVPPKYIKYKENSEMRLHCDHIYSIFENDGNIRGIPTLTMILLLNDGFEGGEFEMFDGQKSYPLKKGEVIIFPSNFLYPHRVTQITKGERNSVATWVY